MYIQQNAGLSFGTFGRSIQRVRIEVECILLLFLPLLAGKFLHVGHLVFLIDNLCTEHGFDDILHGDDTSEATVLVDDNRDVFLLGEQLLPDV